jgi:hypothetical protein
MGIKIVGTYLSPDQVKKMSPAIKPVDPKGKGDKSSAGKGDDPIGRARTYASHSSFNRKI